MPFSDLRQFLDHLEQSKELLYIQEEVDPRYELAAYIRKTSDTGGPALFFHKVKGFDIPVVGGVFAHRRRVMLALQSTEEQMIDRFMRATNNLVPAILVKEGPCQEVVLTGKDADLTRLPIPTFSPGDSAPYITIGMVVSKDPDTGGRNAAIRRLEFKNPSRLGVLAGTGCHLGIHQARAEAQGKALDVAIAIGCEPVIPIINQWKAPYGVDELSLAGALRGKPVEVVRCRTVNLEVPATTEIVIEGRIPPGVREMEGPFGEVTGYQTDAYPKPVIEVTAITHRHNPIYQTVLTGIPTTEHHVLKQLAFDASYYADLKNRFPGVKAVHFPSSGAGSLIAVVSMKQYAKYEARNVIAHMMGTKQNKIVIVVDDDIDCHNIEHVMWAVATRCRPDDDVILYPRLIGAPLDPSAKEMGKTSGLGIDATRPFGESFPQVAAIPGVEKVPDLLALLERQVARKKI